MERKPANPSVANCFIQQVGLNHALKIAKLRIRSRMKSVVLQPKILHLVEQPEGPQPLQQLLQMFHQKVSFLKGLVQHVPMLYSGWEFLTSQ